MLTYLIEFVCFAFLLKINTIWQHRLIERYLRNKYLGLLGWNHRVCYKFLYNF